ncbi:hypothetical protein GCM10022200_27420 [Microbacterium awajiense]|uniref:DUF2207 domain-containing protein n=1 Tax=Microbacterium awajiense TaxID=415214 RepID=A0ABP7AXF4_9MICO
MGRIGRWLTRGLGAALVFAFLGAGASSALAAPAEAPAAPDAAVRATLADVDDFTFDSMDVEYTLALADDGTSELRVVERFVAVFPEFDQNRGMRRSIPASYLGVPLFPSLVSITDEDGRPRAAEADSEDGYYSMTSRADDFVHGRQTYVFTYTLRNVTRNFDDSTGVDEFYWNVNGTEWRQPFGRVSAQLVVAPEIAATMTGAAACYQGYGGSTDPCEIAVTSAGAHAVATDVLPFQTMTIAVGFEPGTFAPFDSSYFASGFGWAQAAAGVGLVLALVWGIATRAGRLRNSPGRPTIIAEYEPPQGVDALESAVLLGKKAKAIPAEVLEQAVVGSIRIVEGKRKFWGGVRLKAVLLDPSRADGDGRMLLRGLFGSLMTPGMEFEFGTRDTRLSSAAQRILKAADQALEGNGLRRHVSPLARSGPVLAAVAAAALVWVFGFFAMGNGVDELIPIALMMLAAVVVFITIGLVAHRPLSAKGAEVRDHLKGLKVFIEWAEADRIRMLQSPRGAERVRVDPNDPRQMLKLYEVLLPYAVVFGQEKQWAKELAILYGAGNSPSWYSGSHGFSASSFSSGISSLSASTASSSSTSGGSSGGGSAGGGGGGGGGGGV